MVKRHSYAWLSIVVYFSTLQTDYSMPLPCPLVQQTARKSMTKQTKDGSSLPSGATKQSWSFKEKNMALPKQVQKQLKEVEV